MQNTKKNYLNKIVIFILIFNILFTSIPNIQAIKFPWNLLFPHTKLALNLGNVTLDNKIETLEQAIETDSQGNKYIKWTFTSDVKNAPKSGKTLSGGTINRYFTTTKDSGLGEPEIISVTKDGTAIQIPSTEGTGKAGQFSSRKESIKIESSTYGKYVYTIKTKILDYRDEYILDINSVLKGNFKKGETVNIAGILRQLNKDEEITVNVAQRHSVVNNAYNELKEDRSDKLEVYSKFDRMQNTYGQYIGENSIRWSSSFANKDSVNAYVKFDLTPDESQKAGVMRIYYLKPSENGYVVDETRTRELAQGQTVAEIADLPSGWIAQAFLDTEVKKDDAKNKYSTMDHYLKNNSDVRLEALYAKLTIKKEWGEAVEAKQKVNTEYTVNGGKFNNFKLTIQKNEQEKSITDSVLKFNIEREKNSSEWTRIKYRVEEKIPAGFRLVFKGENKYDLKYIFKNDKKQKSGGSEIETEGTCSGYGVMSLDPIEINQYRYQKDGGEWFGYGGVLSGKLKVPKNAKSGQYIKLKLPDSIFFEADTGGKAEGSVMRGGTKIADIYHDSDNYIRFVFLDAATATEDYEVLFTIGQGIDVRESGLKFVNGQPAVNDGNKRYPVGINPNLLKFYDPQDPSALKKVTKNLEFETTYYGYKGENEGCRQIKNADVSVHYTDSVIAENVSWIKKSVVEEGEDYLVWDVVYNAKNRKIRNDHKDFYDFLTETQTLYDGNNPESFSKNIKLFRASQGTVSGGAVEHSMKQIYPGNSEYGTTVNVKGNDLKNDKIYGTDFKKSYQLTFTVTGLGTDTLVARIKTKKIRKIEKWYYNFAQSQQSSLSKNPFVGARYAPKKAVSVAQDIYDFSLKKTEILKNGTEAPIKNNPAKFRAVRVPQQDLVVTASTNSEGIAKFVGLKAGKYEVTEIEAPVGYTAYNKKITFEILGDGSITYKKFNEQGVEQSYNYDSNNLPTVVNELRPMLKIKKYDKVTGKPLKGASFKLEKQIVDNMGSGNENTEPYSQTIGENLNLSEFDFASLTAGRYRLTELKAPIKYKDSTGQAIRYQSIQDIEFDVEKIGKTTRIVRYRHFGDTEPVELEKENGIYVFRVDNTPPSRVEFTKTNIYGATVIDNNARFELYAEDTGKNSEEVGGFSTTPANPVKKFTLSDGTTINVRKTHRSLVIKASGGYATDWAETPEQSLGLGKFSFDNLPDGKYVLEEKITPSGYEKPKYPFVFEIKDGALKGNQNGPMKLHNDRKGMFEIHKTNPEGENLSDVEFTLYKENENGTKGKKFNGSTNPVKTDTSGKANFSNIPQGRYILEETKGKPGYDNTETWTVYVDAEAKTTVLDSFNNVITRINNIGNPVAKIVNTKKVNLIIRKREKTQVESSDSIASWGQQLKQQEEMWKQLLDAGVFDQKYIETLRQQFLEGLKTDATNFDGNIKPTTSATENFKVLDAEFELLDENGNSFNPPKKGHTNSEMPNKGILKFEGLTPNKIYHLRETVEPEGYAGLSYDYKFKINYKGRVESLDSANKVVENNDVFTKLNPSGEHNKDSNLIVKNKKTKYKFKIVKIDYSTGQKIENLTTPARFEILDKNKNQVNGQVANLTNGEFTFDNKGGYFAPGKYYIREITPPSDNKGQFSTISPNPIPIRIKGDGTVLIETQNPEEIAEYVGKHSDPDVQKNKEHDGITELKIANAKKQRLVISKRIKGIESIPNLIKNETVSFKLTKDNTNPKVEYVKENVSVNKDVVFEDLLPGIYTLEETKAPIGYMSDGAKYKVVVDSKGANIYRLPKEGNFREDMDKQIIKSIDFKNLRTANPEKYAIDGDDKTHAIYHNFNNRGDYIREGAWIGVDLKQVKKIEYINFVQGHPNNRNDKFDKYIIEYSVDGVHYRPINTYNGDEQIDEKVDITARYIRIRNLKAKGPTWIGIADIHVYTRPYEKLSKNGEKNLFGNIQNPNLNLVKTDFKNNQISNVNAKFELRKIDDNINDISQLNDNLGELVLNIDLSRGNTVLLSPTGTPYSSQALPLTKLGKYILIEKEAPAGYKKLDKPILLELKEKDAPHNSTQNKKVTKFEIVDTDSRKFASIENATNLVKIKVKNEKDGIGSFAFEKRIKNIESNYQLPANLKSRFRLSKDNDNSFIPIEREHKGNEKFVFENLVRGHYTLTEILSPDGYVKDKVEYKVNVDKNNSVGIYSIKDGERNAKIPANKLLLVNGMPQGIPLENKDNIFDGNENTQAIFKPTNSVINKGDFVGVQLDSVYKISNIKYVQDTPSREADGNDGFDEMLLEYSVDGVNYVPYKTYKNTNKDKTPKGKPNTINNISENNLNIYAKYIRFKSLINSGSRWLRINEISITGTKVNLIKYITEEMQSNLQSPDNIAYIGNIQNPGLMLEKIDSITGKRIINNNQGHNFNAKFKLFKVDDNINEISRLDAGRLMAGENVNGYKFIQEFELNSGVAGENSTILQKVSELGRYMLIETIAPNGYNRTNPIFMDLVETQQIHSGALKKNTTAWKIVGDNNNYPIENGYPKFEGNRDLENIKVDYQNLANNKIILKIKNAKNPKGAFGLSKVIKGAKFQGITDFAQSDNLRVNFELIKDSDQNIRFGGEKGAHETYEFKNLDSGIYTLTEKLAPLGYVRKKTPYKVLVDESGNTAVVENLGTTSKINLSSSNLIRSSQFMGQKESGDESKIFDNDENSYVQFRVDNSTINENEYIGVKLDGLYHISRFKFSQGPTPSNTLAGNDAFDNMKIEYSLDGNTYYEYPTEFINENINKTTNGKLGRPNTNANIEKTGQNIVAQYIRIRNTKRATGRWFIMREISLDGYKISDAKTVNGKEEFPKLIKYVPYDVQNQSGENPLLKSETIVKIPNAQNPKLTLEKVDAQNNALISNNNFGKNYNAKFSLYKIADNKTSISESELNNLTESNGFKHIQDFTLTAGKQITIEQRADLLGRYALIETEAPDGYAKAKPIILDLVEVKAEIAPGFPVYLDATAWKVLNHDVQKDESGYDILKGIKDDNQVIIDYSKVGQIQGNTRKGLITLKIKNEKLKANFSLSKRIKGIEWLKGFGDNLTAKFKLSKENDNNFNPIEIEKTINQNFAFKNLDSGRYNLEELKAPLGYVKDKNPYKVYIDNLLNIGVFQEIEGKTDAKISLNPSMVILSSQFNRKSDDELNRLFDGDETTANKKVEWVIGNSTINKDAFIGIDLKKPYHISRFRFSQAPVPADTVAGNNAFDKMVVEYSLDGQNYYQYPELFVNTNNGRPNTIANVEKTDQNIIARYIRIRNLEEARGRWFTMREITLHGKEIKFINYLPKAKQENSEIEKEENLVKIGNIQNPKIELEKVDKDTGQKITNNNQGVNFNAKFVLYKVDNNATSINAETLKNKTPIQEFETVQGALSATVQNISELGRYALVETIAPDGYEKINPILLDLVETRQNHDLTNKKHTTSWKIVGDNFNVDNDNYMQFTGERDREFIKIDYSHLNQNKIIFKIKNQKTEKKIKLRIEKIDKKGKLIKGDNNTSARVFISTNPNAKTGSEAINGQVANLNNGYFEFNNKDNKFGKGLYYLIEERSPTSYIRINKPIPFYIQKSGQIIIPAKLKANSQDEYIRDEDFIYKNSIQIVQTSNTTDIATIKIVNNTATYPSVGGIGIYLFTVSGILLMAWGILLYSRKNKYKDYL